MTFHLGVRRDESAQMRLLVAAIERDLLRVYGRGGVVSREDVVRHLRVRMAGADRRAPRAGRRSREAGAARGADDEG